MTFTIRDLLWLIFLACAISAWYSEVQKCEAKYAKLWNNGSPVASKSNTGPHEGKSVFEAENR